MIFPEIPINKTIRFVSFVYHVNCVVIKSCFKIKKYSQVFNILNTHKTNIINGIEINSNSHLSRVKHNITFTQFGVNRFWSLTTASQSLTDLTLVNKFKASQKNTFTSRINNGNKRGPRLDPCGTSEVEKIWRNKITVFNELSQVNVIEITQEKKWSIILLF
jgi:hypothetical protein